MKRLWPYIYLLLVAVTFIWGAGLSANNYGRTNIDWIFISVSFFVGVIFPPVAVGYARSRSVSDLPLPSLSRGIVGGWWADPWQFLLLTTLLTCSWFLGSLFTLPHASYQGVMLVWWKGACALGFVVGFALAHKRYRGKVN